jgi:hypothetical protein
VSKLIHLFEHGTDDIANDTVLVLAQLCTGSTNNQVTQAVYNGIDTCNDNVLT